MDRNTTVPYFIVVEGLPKAVEKQLGCIRLYITSTLLY